MKNLPIEEQVCLRGQAEKLAELLGNDAPEGLWVWVNSSVFRRWEIKFKAKIAISNHDKQIPAYTGDELGVLLKNAGSFVMPLLAHDKAACAIKLLEEKRIKKGDFRYES